MKKYAGILLCTDFDGTIAEKSKISEENREAVKHFTDNGGLFTIISGRKQLFFTRPNDLPRLTAPAVCLNGAMIIDGDKRICEVTMEPYEICEAINFFRDNSILRRILIYNDLRVTKLIRHKNGYSYCFIDENDVTSEEIPTEPISARIVDGRVVTGIPDVDEALSKGIYKAVATSTAKYCAEEDMVRIEREIIEKVGDEICICRSWPYGIEFLNKNATKGAAVKLLKEYTGAYLSIAIGNYENDTPMIKDADVGVAVGDSSPDAIEAADVITVGCSDHAVADLIYNRLDSIINSYKSTIKQTERIEK